MRKRSVELIVPTREKPMRTAVKRQSEEAKTSGLLMVGLRGEEIIMELCRKEEVNQSLIRGPWSFLKAGKKRLAADITREATRDEVHGPRRKPRI
jgi:transposase